jgi:hypothetical protein
MLVFHYPLLLNKKCADQTPYTRVNKGEPY